MADEKKQTDLQKVNPVRQFELAIKDARGVKDVIKVDMVKDRYIQNFNAISGSTDGLQRYEQESFAFIELANSKPEIMECDPFSIVAGFIRASTYGLSFAGNDLSVYPRGVKQKDGSFKKMLVVEPQAHGKRRLLEMMPTIKEIGTGVLVYKGEKFVHDRQKKKVISHESVWPEPEATEETVVGVYCTVFYKNGDTREIVINQHELKKARNASKMNDGGDLWKTYYGEACKKTVYNRAFKELWKKPESAVLFQQYEAPDEETQDVPHQEEKKPSAPPPTQQDQMTIDISDQTEGPEEAIDTETGEVLTPEDAPPPTETTRRRRGTQGSFL